MAYYCYSMNIIIALPIRKANRTETLKEYRQKVAMVPWDLSRRAFMQLASSPEAFLMLRSHFTHTYATLCMCHYALGIGDRHLSNFMVDLLSGGAVGIDFGHAFGTATQVSGCHCIVVRWGISARTAQAAPCTILILPQSSSPH